MKSTTTNWKDLFESGKCISILLCLKENGPLMKSDLYSKVSRNTSMPNKIDALEELGVISTHIIGRCTIVELTQMGEIITDHLVKIESIVTEPSTTVEGINTTS